MTELWAILIGIVLGVAGIFGLRLARKVEPSPPPFEPPAPQTQMGDAAELDASINPPAPAIVDHVQWADEARARQLFFQNANPETAEEQWDCLLARRKGVTCTCAVCQKIINTEQNK